MGRFRSLVQHEQEYVKNSSRPPVSVIERMDTLELVVHDSELYNPVVFVYIFLKVAH